MSAESSGQKSGIRGFFQHAIRPKKSRQTLRKANPSTADLPRPSTSSNRVDIGDGYYYEEAPPLPGLAPLEAHRLKYKYAHEQMDTQLGEHRDYTTIIHALGMEEMDENSRPGKNSENRPPGERDIGKLPRNLWLQIASNLNPAEAATLTLANKTLYHLLGTQYLMDLEKPSNREYRIDFLVGLDVHLPHHLLCFPCGKYHRRTQEGKERLKPSHVVNPIFNCPEATNSLNPPPRHRITHGRMLPFSFVQLICRANRFGPRYGLTPEAMARRWQRDGWSHTSRFLLHEGRLLMRVRSQGFAAPGQTVSQKRMLLHSREDFWPYFSSCAHWRDGELMPACKCALDHIPRPRETGGLQGIEAKLKDKTHGRVFDPNALTLLCGFCRPMRRCPECPSEYLIEVKLSEDKDDVRGSVFKQAIVVTRWTDLGDGTRPAGKEWASITGASDEYDSLKHYANRGIASIFEAAFTADTLPGQRIISMNPKGEKLGEKGHSWY
ncbi:hypothetical protein N7495_003767 [Penicillium taxi]|uniref:uncharacterized protein n=1 Tax=Penicillium taxi TaxID=168475 RepID=UPI0025458260|nr:uncharacterized protein N7495_003767 [Penicillium taxi]KAJ5899023.1 hypothetical protein N7495_003767 [Penicillium taxi]